MKNKLLFTILLFSTSLVSMAQDAWNGAQKEVLSAMHGLSETTAPNGKGAEAYGTFLTEDFSRWTIGSKDITNKENWVAGVVDWFKEGWRVTERQQQALEILIHNDWAHTRRIVTETYLGPDGDTSVSKAALAEIWVKRDGRWLLFRVNVHPMEI